VERYDPQTDTWTRLADKPTAVSEVSAVLLGEKIYVPGGKLADGKVSNCLEVFDPRKGTWESKAELPHSLVNYGITTYEGSLYVFGGWDGESIQNSVLRYYPDADIWKEMSRMPTAKSRASVVTLGERIFVIGGESDNNKDLFIEVYYPMQDVDGEKPWQKYLSLDSDVKFLGAQEISGRLFLFSLTENGDFQIDSYTPENSSWYTYVEKSSTLPDKQSQLCNMSGEVFF
jgi:N-acetylneuraminic acid mutarotase